MRNLKAIKEAKLDENAWFEIKIGHLRDVGLSDEKIWELVKSKPISLDGCNTDDLLHPFIGYVIDDVEDQDNDLYEILEEEIGNLIEELKFSEVTGIGSNSYMFEVFSETAREDVKEITPTKLKLFKELILLVNEALVESVEE